MLTALSILALLCALPPCLLFLVNLPLYRRLPKIDSMEKVAVSVLIPARNEEANIREILRSVLTATDVNLEVVVLDDHSTDKTAEIVKSAQAEDARVRLVPGKPLPPGWCGKNFACQQLAAAARHPALVFLDADVRMTRSDALAVLAAELENSGVSLLSGVPLEITRTWLERLIIPLIHFVLLAFLPLRQMRAGTDPRFAAACGQVLAVKRTAYLESGGHGAVAGRIHDAVALTRHLRSCGFRTDLFDATDSFRCRMYHNAAEVWNGFVKNAHEGLGAPKLIGPVTLLLFTGQVLPFVLTALWLCGILTFDRNPLALWLTLAAALCAWLPRLAGAVRFRQSITGPLLHPLGIMLLLAIQWNGLLRHLRGAPVAWKGRMPGAVETGRELVS